MCTSPTPKTIASRKFNPEGTFIRTFGFGVSNGNAEAEICTTGCKTGISGSGNGQFSDPQGIAIESSGIVWVTDTGNDRVEEFSEKGEYFKQFGTKGKGEGQFETPVGITLSGGNLYVVDDSNDRVEEFSTSGSDAELNHFGSSGAGGGDFSGPEWIATDPVSGDVYVDDSGHERFEKFTAGGSFVSLFGSSGTGEGEFEFAGGVVVDSTGEVYAGDDGAAGVTKLEIWGTPTKVPHDTQTIDYSAGANSTYPSCGKHPEWVGLTCQRQPTVQTRTGEPLPVTTISYNIWDGPETVTEAIGSATRTKKEIVDGAGRLTGSEVTASKGTSLPKITDEYNSETGALVKQTDGTHTLTSVYNSLGERTSYTDAGGATTTYAYNVSGNIEELSYTLEGKAASQKYTYSITTGALSSLVDSAAGTFTAIYDDEGKVLTVGYPNGMTATYIYNAVGSPVGLTYVKTTHCTTNCTWFSDAMVPGIHNETLSEVTTLASNNYIFDAAGRLTQVQETPAGKGCITRAYTYEEDSNRTNLTTSEPGSKGECTTGGTVAEHTYDEADRLADPGVTYDPFGDATAMPAADAGGNELTSTFYADSQTASEKQNGETITYAYDPGGRTRETVYSGKTANTVISHYSGPGSGVAWAGETGKWTRDIYGIDGALDAIETSSGSPVLQLHDLRGDIVATAALSETETKLLSTYNSSEFGVPASGTTPPTYSWLGALGEAAELPSGISATGSVSYVPELGADLQTKAVVPPGAYPNGSYSGAPYTTQLSAEAVALGNDLAAGAPGREAPTLKAIEEAKAPLTFPPLPVGAIPGPNEESSEEEFSATGGDPMECHVKGKAKSSGGLNSNEVSFEAVLECQRWTPGLQFEMCLQELEGGTSVWGECTKPLSGKGTHYRGEGKITVSECNTGRYYRGWVWWWWPELGRKNGFKALFKPIECQQTQVEFGEEKLP